MKTTRSTDQLVITPDLDNKVIFLQKYPRKEFEGEARLIIALNDALLASRTSQLYHEGYLSAKYQDRIRIHQGSIGHRAHLELFALLQSIPALNNHDLSDGDPGRHLLAQLSQSSKEYSKEIEKPLIANSIEDLYELFITCIEYSFYRRRKKTLSQEFEIAADKMDELRNRYRLNGRFKRNARVGNSKRAKSDLTYLKCYTLATSLSDVKPDEIF